MMQTVTQADHGPSASKRTCKVFLNGVASKWRVTLEWMRRLKSARRQGKQQEDQCLLQAAASASSVTTASSITQPPEDAISKCSFTSVETDMTDTTPSPSEVTSWCRKRPQLVEAPLFLYFLAYKACLPLKVSEANDYINK